MFFINVPLAVVVAGADAVGDAGRGRPAAARSTSPAPPPSPPGSASVVFAVVRAPQAGWTSASTLVAGLVGLVLLGVFVGLQARSDEPLVRLGIFKAPNLAAANAAQFLLGAAWIPMFFFVNLYLQQVLGLGAFASGAALLPLTVTIMVGMVAVAPRLIARFGPKTMTVAGPGHPGRRSGLAVVHPRRRQLPGSTCCPPAWSPPPAWRWRSSPRSAWRCPRPLREEGGLAAGIVNTNYQIGSALGLAAMTAVAAAFGADGSATDPSASPTGSRPPCSVPPRSPPSAPWSRLPGCAPQPPRPGPRSLRTSTWPREPPSRAPASRPPSTRRSATHLGDPRTPNPAISPARPGDPTTQAEPNEPTNRPPHRHEENQMSTFQQTFEVTGMTCGHCVAAVKEEVGAIADVTDVAVDLATRPRHGRQRPRGHPRRDGRRHRRGRLPARLLTSTPHQQATHPPQDRGTEMTATTTPAPSPTQTAECVETSLNIGGMTCASCVRRVEKTLTRVDGVVAASVNLANETATVSYDPAFTSLETLTAAVTKSGYTAAPRTSPGTGTSPTPATGPEPTPSPAPWPVTRSTSSTPAATPRSPTSSAAGRSP